VGAGAASSRAGRRWKNTPVVERYVASVRERGVADCVEQESPDRATQALDFLALGLRLREGVSARVFEERFGVSLRAALGEEGEALVAAGVLERVAGRVRIAADHLLVTNEVLVRLSNPLETAFERAPV
jgi:oxygen-independent coproporphyrinogen-3 oxidase